MVNINLTKMQSRYNMMIDKMGVWIEWLQRITSGSSAYDTGSTITYGYGDFTVYWITGSSKAVVEHVSVKDVVIEAGFREEDYDRIYVPTDSTIEFWDQCIYPSGSGVKYLVLPFHIWRVGLGDTIISKSALIRRLVPKSGSIF